MAARAQPRVLILTGEQVTGVELHRAALPAEIAAAHGYPVTWLHTRDTRRQAALAAADLLVCVRFTWLPEHEGLMTDWLDRLRRGQQRLVCDFDDDVFTPAILSHTAATWPGHWTPEVATAADTVQASIRTLAARAAGITTTTDVLAQRLAPHVTCPVAVVPNMIAWHVFRTVYAAVPRALPPPVIGWVGGDRPASDFAEMLPAWTEIARRYPQTRFVVACGQEPPGLRDAVPADRLTVRGWVPPHHSPAQWRDIDIACLPLTGTAFDACKSPLKALEAGCAGAACVASPTVYGETLRHERDGLIVQGVDAWVAALARLITDPALRRRLATRWTARVEQRHNLDRHWARWIAAWTRLYYGDA